MNKKTKKIINEYKPKTERDRFTMVLEDIHSQNKVFGEHLDLVEQKINEGFEVFGQRFDRLETRVEDGFAKVDKRFEQVDRELDIIKTELGIIRHDLKEKVSRE